MGYRRREVQLRNEDDHLQCMLKAPRIRPNCGRSEGRWDLARIDVTGQGAHVGRRAQCTHSHSAGQVGHACGTGGGGVRACIRKQYMRNGANRKVVGFIVHFTLVFDRVTVLVYGWMCNTVVVVRTPLTV